MIKNKPGKTAPGAVFLSFLLVFFFFLSSQGNLYAQAKLGRMGVLSGDNLTAIRAKADAWFAANGDDGRKQFERWYEINYRQVDAQGGFPSDAKIDLGFRAYLTARLAHETAAANLSIPSPSWMEVRPDSRVSATGLGAMQNYPGHGRVNAIRWDSQNPSHLFCGTAGGGVWESTDNGSSWKPLMDDETDLKYLEIKDLAVAPGAQELYAVASSQISHTSGSGGKSRPDESFYRSLDGGNTWSVFPIKASHSGLEVQWTRILIDPIADSVLYVSGYGGGAGYRGLHRSTNKGATWSHILNTHAIEDMEIDSHQGKSYLYMAAFQPVSGGGYLPFILRHQITHTPGSAPTFQLLTQGLAQVNTSKISQIASDGSGNVYYLLSTEDKSSGNTVRTLSVWKSDNYGDTYTQVSIAQPPVTSQGTVITVRYGGFQVSPDDPNLLYMGAAKLARSEDGGQNWVLVQPDAPSLYVDHNDLQFCPNPSGEVLFDANDSGIQKLSVNKNSSGVLQYAVSRVDQGLEVLQGNRLGICRDHSGQIVIGTHDNGSMHYNRNGQSTASLLKISGGDGQECLIHHNDPDMLYTSVQYGKLYKTTSGTEAGKSVSHYFGGAFSTPVIMDRSDASVLFGADDRIWRTTDDGQTWNVYSDTVVSNVGENLSHLARSRNGTFFYAASQNNFYYSVNGGLDFTPSNGLSSFSSGKITSITSDPSEEGTVYVTLGNYDSIAVLKSSDNGQTFQNHSDSLPAIPFINLVLDPNYLGEAYASGEYGVYFNPDIRDQSSTWTIFGTGLPNVCPFEMEYNANSKKLYAITTGRGLWEVETKHYFDAWPYCTPLGTTRNKNMGISKATFLNGNGQPLFTFNSALNESYSRFEVPASQARRSGSILDLTLKPGSSSSPQRIRVWVDNNDNGSFPNTPIREFIANGSTDEKNLRLAVPFRAQQFRIRVGVDWQASSSDLSPCGRSLYGEYEDYIIPIR